MGYEFEKEDVDATITTMTDEPYVPHEPTLTGDLDMTRYITFTKITFGKMPNDIKIKPLSRTVDKDQVVDEIIISFTRDREIDYMLPSVAPTGKYMEIPYVVIMKFDGSKIADEHIYWTKLRF